MRRTEKNRVGGAVLSDDYSFYFNGAKVGEIGANTGQFNYNMTRAASTGDFDHGYDPITRASEAPAGGAFLVRTGDTLRSIASTLWGDESLWYLLAEANGLSDTSYLPPGMSLAVPNKVVNARHKSTTFEPYDTGASLGSLQPQQLDEIQRAQQAAPQAKAKKGCGAVGKLIVAVVAVAVVAIVAPYAVAGISNLAFGTSLTAATAASAGTLATVAGGAVAGAAASAVSQGAGIALGVQDKFSWKGVALGAISGAVGGGFGTLPSPSGFVQGAIRGVSSNLVTQGISVATGLQKKFDWAGVAIGGVVGGVSASGTVNRFADSLKLGDNWAGQAARNGVVGLAGGVAGAATRSVVTGTSFGDNLTSVLPDVIGSTIGNAIAGRVNAQPKLTPREVSNKVAGGITGALITDRDLTIDDILARANYSDTLVAANAASSPREAARMREQGLRTLFSNIATTPTEQQTVSDFYGQIYPRSAASDFDAMLTVTAGPDALNYFAGKTIDNAGIWVGNKVTALQGGLGDFLRQNPAANLAVNVASVGLTVAGGPVRYVSGLAWEKASSFIEGGISKGYSSAGWSSADAAAGGKGVTFTGSVVLGARGALALRGVAAETVPLNTKIALQGVTNRAVAELAANPSLARDLMSPGSYRHLVEGTNLAPASYGKAVERLSARYVQADPELSQTLSYQSRPFVSTPDFLGYEGYNLRTLDITTEAGKASHLARPYGPYTDYVTHPGLPPSLVFPR
ncbi:LysM peptidoglycan-binding domain-containing protein [Phenylobacterium sp.]|jgi:hypothetical protein|uniref:LysM peptidoglycan-binding domain-containing protein n=1 Tax=Phenylobacterium sp. TaxID=1871053 RepID=UPI0037C6F23E